MRWGRPYKKGHCTSIYGWNRPYKGARALLQHFDALQRALDLLRGPRHLRQVARCSVHACKPSLPLVTTASDINGLRSICKAALLRFRARYGPAWSTLPVTSAALSCPRL